MWNAVIHSAAIGRADDIAGMAMHLASVESAWTADVADDHGFSTWLSLKPNSKTDFQIGYSRSVAYQLNSVFFGVGVRVGH